MDGKYFFYTVLRGAAKALFWVFKPFRVIGREHIPDGPCVVCANHSGMSDPFYVAFALPVRQNHVCFMAKKELFKFKPLGWLLRGLGAFPVDRGAADMEALKTAFRVLKSGKKLGIFPEGTRTQADGQVSPKSGAVRIAEKAKTMILPVYVPRVKRFFRMNTIVIGEPMDLSAMGRMSKETVERLSDELMDNIARLGHNIPVGKGA